MSPALESSGLMKNRSYNVLPCSVPCSLEPGSSGMSLTCDVHPTNEAELLFPLVQFAAMGFLDCFGQFFRSFDVIGPIC